MTDRKQRINIILSPETLEVFEERVPEYLRSKHIEGLLRDDLGLVPLEPKVKGFAVYERSVDCGQGMQTVYVQDGKIIAQFIGSREGLYHSYTGDGNPEWIGLDVSILRGNGFKRVRGARVRDIEMNWLQSETEYEE